MDKIEISKIRIDGGTQSRAGIDENTVAEYAESMKLGAQFPAVIVYFDGADYWLADGFHRTAAAKKAEVVEIAAEVRQGTRRDAVLHSVSANASHGLRRKNEDKRRAIETLLRDDEWRGWSDREIARRVSVDHKTVAAVRLELVQRGEIPMSETVKVQRGNTEYVVVKSSYAATPAADLDVETARQIAVEIVQSEREVMGGEYHVQREDGLRYFVGAQPVEIDGETLKVGKGQIGILLETVNGKGLYRFNIGDLLQWVHERDGLMGNRELMNYLRRAAHEEKLYIDGPSAKKMIKYGLVIANNDRYSITGGGRELLAKLLGSRPVLTVEQRVIDENPRDYRYSPFAGEEALIALYDEQKSSGEWVHEHVLPYNGRDWLKKFTELGYVQIVKRDAAGVKNDVARSDTPFFMITAEGCALIGREALNEPAPLPELPYHVYAWMFIEPGATFKAGVGDKVRLPRTGQIGTVTQLFDYPEMEVKRDGVNWTDKQYDNCVEVVERAKSIQELAAEIATMAKDAGLTDVHVRFDTARSIFGVYAGYEHPTRLIGGYTEAEANRDLITRDVNMWMADNSPHPIPTPAFTKHGDGETKTAPAAQNGIPAGWMVPEVVGQRFVQVGDTVVIQTTGKVGKVIGEKDGGVFRVQTDAMIADYKRGLLKKVVRADDESGVKRSNDAALMAVWYSMIEICDRLKEVQGEDELVSTLFDSWFEMTDQLRERLNLPVQFKREAVLA